MSPGGFLQILGAFLLALGVLIVVHELGHYSAARLCNVKILRFSLGFGRPLWSRKFGRDGTEWSLAAFPLGGYVKMLDEREGEVPTAELGRAFNRQSVARRSFIVVAGPLANLLLAVLLYWFLFMGGVEEPRPILAASLRTSESGSYPLGHAIRRSKPRRWAASTHELATLLPSPMNATRIFRRSFPRSAAVIRSARTWHGWWRSVSPLITGTVAAAASSTAVS